ncbi:MAG: hypothetical protein GOU97_02680 [Nanoarchaeota archaeon]|nr:hypothetical protein [Nanoarchaeota archaeon]
MPKPKVETKEIDVKAEKIVEEVEDEESSKLPFPNAVVVRIMRNKLPRGILIKKKVKIAMNELLAGICEDIAKEMGKEPYAYLDYSTFRKAARKYLNVQHVEKDKERTVLTLKKLNADVDSIIRDLERIED